MNSLEKMTIGDFFKKNVQLFPEHTIQVFENGAKQTYKEIDEKTNKLANGLLNLGLKKGDHVAIIAMNCLEYMEYQLATAKLVLYQSWSIFWHLAIESFICLNTQIVKPYFLKANIWKISYPSVKS
jgi:non-ribosomal peptide synthetase component E (peptide arylation enzyme)